MRGWVVWVALVLVFGVVAATAIFVSHRDELVTLWVGRKPDPPVAYSIPLPDPGTELPWIGPEGVDQYGYPKKTVSVVGLLALVHARRFDVLTRHVEQLQSEFEHDSRKEYWATDAIEAFDIPDPSLEQLLDAWVVSAPKSFAPVAARAQFRLALGLRARGTASMAKTSFRQLAGLRENLKLARQDAEHAIELRPRALASYLVLLQAGMHDGTARASFDRAVVLFPTSFRLYMRLLFARVPRWGGSVSEIAAIVRSGQAHVSDNPKLAVLEGFPYWSTADDRMVDGDYRGALAAADQAVAVGEQFTYLSTRGDAKRHLKDYVGALTDYDHVLALRPEDDEVLRNRAYVCDKLEHWEDAGESFLRAIRVNPTLGLNNLRVYAHDLVVAARRRARDGDFAQAQHDVGDALLLNPAEVEAKRMLAALQKGEDPNAHGVQAEQAIARAEKDGTLESYLALDDALANEGRFDEITEAWTRYIAKHPDSGRAYLERGGAYTHVAKLGDAMRDAEKACELGEKLGCRYVEKYRTMSR